MSKKIFITGSEGFVGKKLVNYLGLQKHQIFAHSGKLENHVELRQALTGFAPDVVIHLAALSNVPYCEKHIDQAYISNVAGTGILLELMMKLDAKPHLVFASSAQVYNMQSPKISEKPVDESFELRPSNVYGRTKRQAEELVFECSSIFGLKAVVLRLFNHTHKDQDLSFFLPSMYRQIREAADGGTISVGNLEVSRDFSLVSDLLTAFEAVILNLDRMDQFELFNVCSGQARNLRELVMAMAKLLGKEINLSPDPQRYRHGESMVIIGNGDKLNTKTGFQQPRRSIDEYIRCFAE
jgi:nucleoside-diphosphate-sugar epimerase